MGEILPISSKSDADIGTHIPLVKEKVGGIDWAPAVVLEGQADAFDWIVITLYQKLEAALTEGGKVGVAAEFEARVGHEVKLRALYPYRQGNYVVCEFLILRTPTAVSVTVGRGKYFEFGLKDYARILVGLIGVNQEFCFGNLF